MNANRNYVSIATATAVALSTAWMGSAATAQDRVVVALSFPQSESNLFWAGTGERMPNYQALVGHDPVTGEFDNSELAESWSSNDDFTEWTFKLKPDATFHFGFGGVTAADVIHSYELMVSDESTINSKSQLMAQSVEAVDDHTVLFTFDTPRVNYPFLHAGRGAMIIYSKAQFDAEGIDGYLTKPAGTSVYEFVQRDLGVGVTFERVEDHWQGFEPDFDTLEMRWSKEPATLLAMVLSGEADIASLPREIQASAVNAGKVVIRSHQAAMATNVVFNGMYNISGDEAARPGLPWNDIRIREAMNRSLDREAMRDILYEGRGDLIPNWLMDPRYEGYTPELVDRFDEKYGHDPGRAKALLAEAGYPDAFEDPVIQLVTFQLTGNPEFETMMELIQIFFEEVGLQTELRQLDAATVGNIGRNREAYFIHPARNSPIRPSEAGIVNFNTAAGAPYGGFEDDTIEAMAKELSDSIDPAKRNEVASDIFTYLFEQYAEIPIVSVQAEVVVNPDVVSDWTFPGVTTNSVSHWHLIEAAE